VKHLTVKHVKTERIPPDPKGAALGMQRIGYSLEEAVADLVDNSIDASASNILVRFFRNANSVTQVAFVDNGKGMDETTLHRAMQYGVQTEHHQSDLGKYGIGLKTASFSQCQSLSVFSKQKGLVHGRRWTLTRMQDDWRCEILDPEGCRLLFEQKWGGISLEKSGTIVLWDDLDALSSGSSDVNKLVSKIISKSLPVDLGIRFHRFLSAGTVSLMCDVFNHDGGDIAPVPILPLDPFDYGKTGRNGYPISFHVEVPGRGKLCMAAHIWPPKSEKPEYKLGGGRVAERQGFYFYRNDRLIQVGGWNGVRESDSEPHLSLARVLVDLPPSLDATFGLLIQKSKVVPPPSFKSLVKTARAGNTSFDDYIAAADESYRASSTHVAPQIMVPGKGLPVSLQRKLGRILSAGENHVREIQFEWKEMDSSLFFEADPGNDVVYLNLVYRPLLAEKRSHSSSDIPLVKSLLFLLVSPHLQQERRSKRSDDWHARCNQILIAAIRAMQ